MHCQTQVQLQTVSPTFDKHSGGFKSGFRAERVFVSVCQARWGHPIQDVLGGDSSGLQWTDTEPGDRCKYRVWYRV